VTVSIGLAAYQPGRPYLSSQSLLQAADEALYLAKHTGRDRICLAA
jgi:PleD family two-component response regulator